MAEWIYEAGIGEARAALIERGAIIEAAVERDGSGPRAGAVEQARLVEIVTPRLSARIALKSGGEALLDGIPAGLSEGQSLLVRIVREAIPETGRHKLPKAVPAPEAAAADGPDLLARIEASGYPVRSLAAHEPDALEQAGWSELIEEAESGEIAFAGGALRLSVTPAMTLFDVDGSLPPAQLAPAAATAVALAIRRLGIGGSIGIDFPTLPDKAARKMTGDAFDAALPPPFERTAINGFGFMQVVRRRVRASIPEILRDDPSGAALRAALRRIERDPPPPGQTAALSPALLKRLSQTPEWTAELARRTGRTAETLLGFAA